MQFVSALELKLIQQRQVQSHPFYRRQKHSVTRIYIYLVVNRSTCRSLRARFVSIISRSPRPLAAIRSGDVVTEKAGGALQDLDHPGNSYLIAGLNKRCIRNFERLAFAEDRLQGRVGKLPVDR